MPIFFGTVEMLKFWWHSPIHQASLWHRRWPCRVHTMPTQCIYPRGVPTHCYTVSTHWPGSDCVPLTKGMVTSSCQIVQTFPEGITDNNNNSRHMQSWKDSQELLFYGEYKTCQENWQVLFNKIAFYDLNLKSDTALH